MPAESLVVVAAEILARNVARRLWGEADGPPPDTAVIHSETLVVDEDPQPPIPFDNRNGTTSFEVRRAFTAEWSQTYEVSREHQDATRVGMSVGASGAKLEFAAEEAIKAAYAITETKRETRSDEVTFEVPAGVRRDVRVIHRRIWRHGVVRFERGEDKADIPFRVLANVEIGYDFQDQAAPPS